MPWCGVGWGRRTGLCLGVYRGVGLAELGWRDMIGLGIRLVVVVVVVSGGW